MTAAKKTAVKRPEPTPPAPTDDTTDTPTTAQDSIADAAAAALAAGEEAADKALLGKTVETPVNVTTTVQGIELYGPKNMTQIVIAGETYIVTNGKVTVPMHWIHEAMSFGFMQRRTASARRKQRKGNGMNVQIDLVTIEEMRTYLGPAFIPVSGNPDLIAQYEFLITAVSQWAATYCNRSFGTKTYTEVLDGTGTSRMVMRNRPVTAVASLGITGNAIEASAAFRDRGYQFDDISVTLMQGAIFPRLQRGVDITYTAGWILPTGVPYDLKQAVMDTVQLKFKRRNDPDIASRTIANETISYQQAAQTVGALRVFNEYRNVI